MYVQYIRIYIHNTYIDFFCNLRDSPHLDPASRGSQSVES